MKKIIDVFTQRIYDANAVACQLCELKRECKSTDAQICLHKDSVQKVDLLSLDVQGYTWVVLLRDHYRGNTKGEYFLAADYDRIKREQPFFFTNTERPVYTVILTDNDVPAIITKRSSLIKEINSINIEINRLNRPKKEFDGRKTRRTAPELYAEYDKQVAAYNSQMSVLFNKKTDLMSELENIENYSTLLVRVKPN